MPARGDGAHVVLLKDQDRSLWDPALISEGQALVLACMRRRRLGPFQLQAAIQALHCAARRYEDTDWAAIVRFYDRLIAVMPTPVVALNRAVAVAETQGPEAGLALLDDLAEELDGYHLLHAARGSLLERLGRPREAADAYDRAAALARTDTEISFLSGGAPSSPPTSGEAARLGASQTVAGSSTVELNAVRGRGVHRRAVAETAGFRGDCCGLIEDLTGDLWVFRHPGLAAVWSVKKLR